MNLAESFKIATRALSANKTRAALTMLGIIIGVSSVILLISIGTGVRDDVLGQFDSLGSNVIYVLPNELSSAMEGGTMTAGSSPLGVGSKKFSLKDVDLVNSKLSVGTASPVLEGGVSVSNGRKEGAASFTGSDGKLFVVGAQSFSAGRYYTDSEVKGAARVAVIGSSIASKYFPTGNAVGKSLLLNGQSFHVIGVLAEKGGTSSVDNTIDMPHTSASNLINSSDISIIAVKVDNPEDIQIAKVQIKAALRPYFGTKLSLMTQDQMLGMVSTLVSTMTYMLAGIASISLLVGGIGIMNIMLVSVSERTREIGIRKAIGARTHDILAQFVIEAVLLSVLGGIIGIILGAVGAWLISFVLATKVTSWSVAIAFFFSVAVGVFFGVYPASKASKLNPIDALRYE